MNEILKFQPFFKSVLWGGKRIAEFKGLPSQGDHVGESWELSPMEGHESVVSEGTCAGKNLVELIAEYGNDIMGERLMKSCGGKFPLLIKFIDSNDDLSIQVHPDDKLAGKRHNSLGKTEMWYSIIPTDDAYLYASFSEKLSAEDFRRRVADNTIVGALRKFNTKPGDVFFLPAGRVHSIGRGNFVLEIQEASDITYRIYDYDRRDANGQPRQLHVEESVDATDFDDTAMENALNVKAESGKALELAKCNYFNTELIGVDSNYTIDLTPRNSFTILIATAGNLTIEADGKTTDLRQGETALVPASVKSVDIKGNGNVVSVYIP